LILLSSARGYTYLTALSLKTVNDDNKKILFREICKFSHNGQINPEYKMVMMK
jgi:hypothetical protein